VNRGKNLGYIECEKLDQDDRLVAKATAIRVVLRVTGQKRAEEKDSRQSS
jgi:hypothetical protein